MKLKIKMAMTFISISALPQPVTFGMLHLHSWNRTICQTPSFWKHASASYFYQSLLSNSCFEKLLADGNFQNQVADGHFSQRFRNTYQMVVSKNRCGVVIPNNIYRLPGVQRTDGSFLKQLADGHFQRKVSAGMSDPCCVY